MGKFLDPISVLAYLTRWDTTRAFLLTLTPEHVQDLYPWMHYNTLGYPVTRDNLDELERTGRSDIAEFLISTVAAPELLTRIVNDAGPQNWLLAVTGHRAASTRTRLRAAVLLQGTHLAEPAQENVAEVLRTHPQDVPQALQYAHALLAAPDSDLPHILEQIRTWDPTTCGDATSALATLTLDREHPLTEETWQALLAIAARNPLLIVEEISRSGKASTSAMLELLHAPLDSAGAAFALIELLHRNVPAHPNDYPALLQADDRGWLNEFTAAINNTDHAWRMLEHEGTPARAAIESGHLPDSAVNLLLAEALSNGTNARVPTRRAVVLSAAARHATDPDLLEQAVTAIEQDPFCDLVDHVVRNPHLTSGQQARLAELHNSFLPFALAQNPNLDLDVARRLANRYSTPAVDTWMSITSNPHLPMETRQSMPAPVAVQAVQDRVSGMGAIVQVLEGELGADLQRWREFEQMLPEWHGTIGELARMLHRL